MSIGSDSDNESFFSTMQEQEHAPADLNSVLSKRQDDFAEIARLKGKVGKLRSLNQQGNSPSRENTMFSTLSQRMAASASGRELGKPLKTLSLSQRMAAAAADADAAAAEQEHRFERENKNTLPPHSSMLSQRMAASYAAPASPEQNDQEESEFWGESSSSVQNPELESLRQESITGRMDAEKEERQFWDARNREVAAGDAVPALKERSKEEMKIIFDEERRRAMALRAAAAAPAAAAPVEKKGFFRSLFKRGGKHTHRRKKSKSALSRKNFKRYSVKGKRRNLRKSRR
jgi:hypothetical protein